MTDIQTAWLDEPKHGPGGNWFHYKAWREADESIVGYGTTAREAINDLKSQMDKKDD